MPQNYNIKYLFIYYTQILYTLYYLFFYFYTYEYLPNEDLYFLRSQFLDNFYTSAFYFVNNETPAPPQGYTQSRENRPRISLIEVEGRLWIS